MSSAQVSSMKSTTKLCRFLIDDRRSTVILRRWIGIDRRYRPYSPVSESASSWLTVDIHRDRSTGLINRWISVSMWPGFGTISHHAWDHEFLVDVCPGPFLMTYGTIMIGQWSFFKQRGRLISIRYESTSTIDSSFDRFFSEIDGRCDIDRIFIDRRYRPWQINQSIKKQSTDWRQLWSFFFLSFYSVQLPCNDGSIE